jgi:hypothetical protein
VYHYRVFRQAHSFEGGDPLAYSGPDGSHRLAWGEVSVWDGHAAIFAFISPIVNVDIW